MGTGKIEKRRKQLCYSENVDFPLDFIVFPQYLSTNVSHSIPTIKSSSAIGENAEIINCNFGVSLCENVEDVLCKTFMKYYLTCSRELLSSGQRVNFVLNVSPSPPF